jgi:hypothetical protein
MQKRCYPIMWRREENRIAANRKTRYMRGILPIKMISDTRCTLNPVLGLVD